MLRRFLLLFTDFFRDVLPIYYLILSWRCIVMQLQVVLLTYHKENIDVVQKK
jgi:hypothetical protein